LGRALFWENAWVAAILAKGLLQGRTGSAWLGSDIRRSRLAGTIVRAVLLMGRAAMRTWARACKAHFHKPAYGEVTTADHGRWLRQHVSYMGVALVLPCSVLEWIAGRHERAGDGLHNEFPCRVAYVCWLEDSAFRGKDRPRNATVGLVWIETGRVKPCCGRCFKDEHAKGSGEAIMKHPATRLHGLARPPGPTPGFNGAGKPLAEDR